MKTAEPVCMHCSYSLVGLVDPRCPECGESFNPDQIHQAEYLAARAFDVHMRALVWCWIYLLGLFAFAGGAVQLFPRSWMVLHASCVLGVALGAIRCVVVAWSMAELMTERDGQTEKPVYFWLNVTFYAFGNLSLVGLLLLFTGWFAFGAGFLGGVGVSYLLEQWHG